MQIYGESTLHQLSSVILDSFDFMDDHNHLFFMSDEPWSDQNCYYRFRDEDDRQSTAKVTLNQVGLTGAQNFLYIFDFGDELQFKCRVLHILNENTGRPIILEAHGTPSEQYGDPEDDYEEESNEIPIK